MKSGWSDFFGDFIQSNSEDDLHDSEDRDTYFSHDNPLQKASTWARTSAEYYDGLTTMELDDVMDQASIAK